MRYLLLILSLCSIQLIFGENYKIYPNITGKEETNKITTETKKLETDYLTKLGSLSAKTTTSKSEIESTCKKALENRNEETCLVLDENNNVIKITKPAS